MDYRFDRVNPNRPINDNIMRKSWIYDGKDETEFSAFTGRSLNSAPKNLYSNMMYSNKVLQIVKSICGLFENNYTEYNPIRPCCENDYCPHKNDKDYDSSNYCPYQVGEAVEFDGVYYISLTDDNNKPLTDKNAWYEFRWNRLDTDNYVIEDVYYTNRYKLQVNRGVLEVVKIFGDETIREEFLDEYSQDTEDKKPFECTGQSLEDVTTAFKGELEELKTKYNTAMNEITTKYNEKFALITKTNIDEV